MANPDQDDAENRLTGPDFSEPPASSGGPDDARVQRPTQETTRIDLSQAIRTGRWPPPCAPAGEAPESAEDERRRRILLQSTLPLSASEPWPPGDERTVAESDLSVREREALLRKRTVPVNVEDPTKSPRANERPASLDTLHWDLLNRTTAPIEEAAKAKTARIELPPAYAPAVRGAGARPKTIKIKRAEGAGQRQASTGTAKGKARSPRVNLPDQTPTPFGVVPAAFMLLSILVIGVLVYLLLAQTVAPNLPVPGRL